MKREPEKKSSRLERRAIAGALMLLGVVALARVAPRMAPGARGPVPVVAPEPALPGSSGKTPAGAPGETPRFQAPEHYYLAAGFAVAGGPRVDVSPETGDVTFFENDRVGSFEIRRARTSGDRRPGIFGLGWRSELGSRIERDGTAIVVLRIEGARRFEPVSSNVFASETGEVELLVTSPEGATLSAADGRTFHFGTDGALGGIEASAGSLTIAQAGASIRVSSPEGVLDLTLEDGRVTRASCGEPSVTYSYDGGSELKNLRGAATRTYATRNGRITRIDGASGTILEARYDRSDRIAHLESRGVAKSYEIGITAKGERAAVVTDAAGETRYEIASSSVLVEHAGGELERVSFDERGRIASVERGGATTRVGRDGFGRIATVEDTGATVGIAYDETGALARVAVGPWALDASGVSGPWGKVTLDQDRSGRILRRRDESGLDTSFTYDAAGHTTLATPVRGSPEVRVFEGGLLTRASNGDGSIDYRHDARGLVERVESSATGVVLSYGHDARGNTDRVTTPWGETRIERGDTVETRVTPAGRFRFERDELGRVIALTYPDGTVGRVEGSRRWVEAGSPVLELEREATAVTRDGKRTSYAFDAQDRLELVTCEGESTRYTFDAAGNRASETTGTSTIVYRHDALQRLLSVGADTVESDAAGRIVARHRASGVDRFEYDGFGRLVRVARAGRPAVSFTYDARCHVASRTVSGKTTRYVYDGANRVAELGSDGSERVFVNGPGIDEPLAYRECGRWTFLHADEQGSVLAYTDATGKKVGSVELDPFGKVLASPGDVPVFFAGRPYDADAGLYDMRARFYDPELGQFLTPDPSGPDGGPNAFAYVHGNPVDATDPLGLWEAPGFLKKAIRYVGNGARNTMKSVCDAAEGAAYLCDLKGSPLEVANARAGANELVGERIGAAYETARGSAEGAAYLSGFYGDAAETKAARKASVEDVLFGRAKDRVFGTVDAYGKGLGEMVDGTVELATLGNYKSEVASYMGGRLHGYVSSEEEYRTGRAFGDAGTQVLGWALAADGALTNIENLPGELGKGSRGLRSAAGAVRRPAFWRSLPRRSLGLPRAVRNGAVNLARGKIGAARQFVAREATSFGALERVAPGVLRSIEGPAAGPVALPIARTGEGGSVPALNAAVPESVGVRGRLLGETETGGGGAAQGVPAPAALASPSAPVGPEDFMPQGPRRPEGAPDIASAKSTRGVTKDFDAPRSERAKVVEGINASSEGASGNPDGIGRRSADPASGPEATPSKLYRGVPAGDNLKARQATLGVAKPRG